MTLEWRYREYRGPNDAVAPHEGAYWITDEDYLVARVWSDDETKTYQWDVTEAEEVEYGGTPCNFGRQEKREDAQAEATVCLRSCKEG